MLHISSVYSWVLAGEFGLRGQMFFALYYWAVEIFSIVIVNKAPSTHTHMLWITVDKQLIVCAGVGISEYDRDRAACFGRRTPSIDDLELINLWTLVFQTHTCFASGTALRMVGHVKLSRLLLLARLLRSYFCGLFPPITIEYKKTPILLKIILACCSVLWICAQVTTNHNTPVVIKRFVSKYVVDDEDGRLRKKLYKRECRMHGQCVNPALLNRVLS